MAKVEKQLKDIRINPECEIAEKANRRFNFFWYKAPVLPAIIEKKPQKMVMIDQKG